MLRVIVRIKPYVDLLLQERAGPKIDIAYKRRTLCLLEHNSAGFDWLCLARLSRRPLRFCLDLDLGCLGEVSSKRGRRKRSCRGRVAAKVPEADFTRNFSDRWNIGIYQTPIRRGGSCATCGDDTDVEAATTSIDGAGSGSSGVMTFVGPEHVRRPLGDSKKTWQVDISDKYFFHISIVVTLLLVAPH